MRIVEREAPEILFLLDACHWETLDRVAHLGTQLTAAHADITEPFCAFVARNMVRYGYLLPANGTAKELAPVAEIVAHHPGIANQIARDIKPYLQGEFEYLMRQVLSQGNLLSSYFYAVAQINGLALLIPPAGPETNWKIAALRLENAQNIKDERACLTINTMSQAAARSLRKLCIASIPDPNDQPEAASGKISPPPAIYDPPPTTGSEPIPPMIMDQARNSNSHPIEEDDITF